MTDPERDALATDALPDWYAAELAAGDGVCRHPTCNCKTAVAYRAGRAAERERIRQLAIEHDAAADPCTLQTPFEQLLDGRS